MCLKMEKATTTTTINNNTNTINKIWSSSSTLLMGRYELGKLLGQGTFAKVYLARNIHTGCNVAIKVVNKAKIIKVGLMDQIKREISVMKLVRHPNIVELYEVMATRGRIYFVMEYVSGGELFSKIAKQGKLTEDEARKYFQQLISAVDYCHSRGVYHRDLKPENLLLSECGDLKVSDFGLSALGESRGVDGLLHTTCGTPAYVAPEVIGRMGYDGAKADIWSCGVVLFVLVAGYLPFRDANLMEMYRKIGKGEFRCPGWLSKEVRRLLSRILDPDPETRATVGKIRKSTWFKQGGVCNDPGSERRRKMIDRNVVEGNDDNNNQLLLIDSSPPRPADESDFIDLCSNPDPIELKTSGFPTKTACYNMNAFDIISLSEGFDLSGLFEEKKQRKEVRFSAWESASTIVTKLEEVAKLLRIKVKKKDGGKIKFEGRKVGRKGTLAFEAEIFEVTPTFHMVEMKKSSGDTLEYKKVVKEDIRPALKDIIWIWQGGDQEQKMTGQQEEVCSDDVNAAALS